MIYSPFATKLTREHQAGKPINNCERDTKNRKPFRSKRQKALAREQAVKSEDGAFRSPVPVQYHS